MRKESDMVGKCFGRLTVIKREGSLFRDAAWKCKCLCKKEVVVNGALLRRGTTKSCGCLRRELMRNKKLQNTIHGQGRRGSSTPEYKAWHRAKTRCLNPKNTSYKNYGGRGIQFCERWLNSFQNFFQDMGKKPSPRHSIDRINNDGHYEPGNCRWATKKEQVDNRRKYGNISCFSTAELVEELQKRIPTINFSQFRAENIDTQTAPQNESNQEKLSPI